MTTGIVWDERFAWHDAGLASTSPWSEPYPALDRPETKRRIWSLLQASGLAEEGTLSAVMPEWTPLSGGANTRGSRPKPRASHDRPGGISTRHGAFCLVR